MQRRVHNFPLSRELLPRGHHTTTKDRFLPSHLEVLYFQHLLCQQEVKVVGQRNFISERFYIVQFFDNRFFLPAWMADPDYCNSCILIKLPQCSLSALQRIRSSPLSMARTGAGRLFARVDPKRGKESRQLRVLQMLPRFVLLRALPDTPSLELMDVRRFASGYLTRSGPQSNASILLAKSRAMRNQMNRRSGASARWISTQSVGSHRDLGQRKQQEKRPEGPGPFSNRRGVP